MKKIQIVQSITKKEDDAIKLYFKDIYKYKPLTLEEEIALSKQIKNGDRQALEKLVTANLRFVVTVAKQYQHQGLSLSDLISEGNYGLTHAAELYDGEKGFKFISYAVWWIRQAITQAIYNHSRTVRFPVGHSVKAAHISKATTEFESQNGRPPTDEELAEILDMSIKTIENTIRYNKSSSSMETPLTDEEGSLTLGDTISSYDKTDKECLNSEQKEFVQLLLSKLKCREQDILRLYFGIGVEEMDLEAISIKFGMTSERIRQLKEKALQDIRNTNLYKELE